MKYCLHSLVHRYITGSVSGSEYF